MKLNKINEHFFPGKTGIKQSYMYLKGEVDHESTAPLIQEIIAANLAEDEEPIGDPEHDSNLETRDDVINIFICSPGGEVAPAMSLIAVMEASEIPIRTIALGEAGSAALMIFLAGHQRIVTPYSSLLSHQFYTGTEGNYSSLRTGMAELHNYHEKIVKLYMEKTGLDRKKVEKYLLKDTDTWLKPEEAVKWNIADLLCDLK